MDFSPNRAAVYFPYFKRFIGSVCCGEIILQRGLVGPRHVTSHNFRGKDIFSWGITNLEEAAYYKMIAVNMVLVRFLEGTNYKEQIGSDAVKAKIHYTSFPVASL